MTVQQFGKDLSGERIIGREKERKGIETTQRNRVLECGLNGEESRCEVVMNN